MTKPRDRWLGVELRHFAALEAIARTRSFRGAADELGYVQSAISQQIASLERVVGQRLIDRSPGPRPLRLTPRGELLLRHADDILDKMRAAKADLGGSSADTAAATIKVGTLEGIGASVLPGVLANLHRRAPSVAVTVADRIADSCLLELVRQGDLDVAIVELPAPAGPFSVMPLCEAAWTILIRTDAPATPATLEELARLPLIARHRSRSMARIEEDLLRPCGFSGPVLRVDSLDLLEALVAAGVGVGLAPAASTRDEARGVRAVPMGHLLPPLAVGLVWHAERTLSPALQTFCAAAADAATAPRAVVGTSAG